MLRSDGDILTRAAVSLPLREYAITCGLQRHNLSQPCDPEAARRQHSALRQALSAEGVTLVEVPESPGHPNSVFAMDPVTSSPNGLVRLRMGLPTRLGEEAWFAEHLASLGVPLAGRIEPPGTVEGGDVLLDFPVALIGRSQRTNSAGPEQMKAILCSMGFSDVRLVEVPTPFLHLGGAMTIVAPRAIVCSGAILEGEHLGGFDVIEVPERDFVSGNVIGLGAQRAVVEQRNRAAIRALQSRGYRCITLDLSEFIKGNGGPSCLIAPLERSRA